MIRTSNVPSFASISRRSARGGFTLFEMLLVLGIISLLMGFVIYNLSGVQTNAQFEKANADILTLREALSSYQIASGTLPTTEQGLSVLWSKPTAEPVPSTWRKQMDDEVKDPWGHSYQYLNPGKHNPDRYDIFSMGPDGQPGTADDVGNWKDDSSKP